VRHIFLSAAHFSKCGTFYQLWLIFSSVAHFFQAQHDFPSVEMFFKCGTFFFSIVGQLSKCGTIFQVWHIVSSVAQHFWKSGIYIFPSLVHFSK